MFHLKQNLPAWERRLRIALGLAITLAAGAFFTFTGRSPLWLPALAAASGAVVVLTGFVGFCPACAMVGRKPQSPR